MNTSSADYTFDAAVVVHALFMTVDCNVLSYVISAWHHVTVMVSQIIRNSSDR